MFTVFQIVNLVLIVGGIAGFVLSVLALWRIWARVRNAVLDPASYSRTSFARYCIASRSGARSV